MNMGDLTDDTGKVILPVVLDGDRDLVQAFYDAAVIIARQHRFHESPRTYSWNFGRTQAQSLGLAEDHIFMTAFSEEYRPDRRSIEAFYLWTLHGQTNRSYAFGVGLRWVAKYEFYVELPRRIVVAIDAHEQVCTLVPGWEQGGRSSVLHDERRVMLRFEAAGGER